MREPPFQRRLSDGRRHFHDGPIDLVIEAFGEGHAVEAMPVMLSPSSWLRRPKAQNTSTQATSMPNHTGPRRGRSMQ